MLQEAEREGPTETARKNNLAYSVLSNWKCKYLSKGRDGLNLVIKRSIPNFERWKKKIPG
ncbi:hypothetical protein [Dyadobacter sp. SG02]|uniref:hypothetical protein n=1 Tax=Dyadobacter sp. SG02 TaxID=1855291 RepID=UPI0038D453C7